MTAKKAIRKKTAAGKAPQKTVIEILEGSVIGQPIVIANKAFLAGLGILSYLQTDFGPKVSELAKDGEVVRDQYRSSLLELRDKVVGQVKGAGDQIIKQVKSVRKSVAEKSPVPTADDIDALNRKMDKVLAAVTK